MLAQSVFKAFPGDSSSLHKGTAFHVGGNLILTNQHVLSVARTNTTMCKRFSIRLNANQKNKSLKCKKVHYCNKALDFCLIEMRTHKKGYALEKQPSLQLQQDIIYSRSTKTMAIGNTQGYGIHASTGFGVEDYQQVIKFYAPVFGGNSGGPLLNDDGEVVALVRSQSPELMSSSSYNIAVTIETIKGILEEKLSDNPEILDQINFLN